MSSYIKLVKLKQFSCAIAIALASLLASSAQAQVASRIAVFDELRAVMQTDAAQKKVSEFKSQSEVKENMKELEGLQKSIRKLAEAYEKDRPVMSEEKREAAKRKILEKQQDYKYVQSKLQQVQEQFFQTVLQQRAGDLQKVLERFVKEENIGLLLSARAPAVMHADASYDISDQITERLNAIK